MKRRVIDTNVAIVANGRKTNASNHCRNAAIDALSAILKTGRIVVDDAGEMIAEYRSHCDPKGQPGVGDRFFRELFMNYTGRVERVSLKKRPNGSFVDFPDAPELSDFDLADRKFVAAARKTAAVILNAVDSDWLDHHEALEANGVKVEFICGKTKTNWFS